MMKKIFFFIALITLFSCGGGQKESAQLPGDFKYVAYRWNDSADSVGISLQHYLNITPKGEYSLVLRDDNGNAKYYYGYTGNDLLSSLISFTKDASFNDRYIDGDSTSAIYNGPQFRFDYTSGAAAKTILFIPPFAPETIKITQATLDSLINAPGKKERSAFNINDYLRKIIAEDSAMRSKPPLVKTVLFKTPKVK